MTSPVLRSWKFSALGVQNSTDFDSGWCESSAERGWTLLNGVQRRDSVEKIVDRTTARCGITERGVACICPEPQKAPPSSSSSPCRRCCRGLTARRTDRTFRSNEQLSYCSRRFHGQDHPEHSARNRCIALRKPEQAIRCRDRQGRSASQSPPSGKAAAGWFHQAKNSPQRLMRSAKRHACVG